MSLFCDNCLIVTFIPSYVSDFEGTSGSVNIFAMREKILAFFDKDRKEQYLPLRGKHEEYRNRN